MFQSNRYGSDDLFVQELDARNARDLVTGAGDQRDALPTPDGTAFLYWESEEGANRVDHSRRLIRIPQGGGPTDLVLAVPGPADLDCGRTSEREGCLLREYRIEEHAAVLSILDPETGRGNEVDRTDLDFASWDPQRSDHSPNGAGSVWVAGATRLGLNHHYSDRREIEVEDLPGMQLKEVQWSIDGTGFYVVAGTGRGPALLHVDLEGRIRVLYEEPMGNLLAPRPSPDGRHLAFGKTVRDGNAWMIEGL